MTAFPHVYRPLRVGPRVLRNRVYVPAHQPGLAVDGMPGERYIAYQRTRARAGAGMQITGAIPVAPSAVWPANFALQLTDDHVVPGFAALADAVHEEGGLMLAQLAHIGGGEFGGNDAFTASPYVSELTRQPSRQADADDLDGAVAEHVAAAGRAYDAGLDGIELVLAYGYLLHSFVSPLMNHRGDELDGDLAHRMSFPLRVAAAVRARIGRDRMLGVRFVCDEFLDGGIGVDEGVAIARTLEASGLFDYLSVVTGNNLRRMPRVRHWPPTPAPHMFARHLARAVKGAVALPVCSVGRITSLTEAEDVLASGDADLVGMVRAHIADPHLLVKGRAGRAAEIRPCVGANVCINSVLDEHPVRCVANPAVGREDAEPPPRADGERVVVVGGGPGGLEAGRRLAERGCAVTLFERAERLGGQAWAWSAAPSRAEVRSLLDWWAGRLDALGVDVRTGTEGTAEEIGALDPALAVLATGAVPDAFTVPTDGSATTVGVIDALTGRVPGDGVVVVDELGRLDAAYVAEKLAGEHHRVTLVTNCVHLGEGEGLTTVYPMLQRLAEMGVEVVERACVTRVEAGTVHLDGVFGEAREPVTGVDALVTWTGAQPDRSLRQPLRALGIETVLAGDARVVQRMADAVEEAAAAVDDWLARRAAAVPAAGA